VSESYVRFFILSEAPFSKEIQDGDLWLPPSKEEIIDEVCEAVHEHAQVMLVGEPGAGKTCVLRAVHHRLPQPGFRLTYCHNATRLATCRRPASEPWPSAKHDPSVGQSHQQSAGPYTHDSFCFASVMIYTAHPVTHERLG
jgi:hypothetical protein